MSKWALNANNSSEFFNTLKNNRTDDFYKYKRPLNNGNAVNCTIVEVKPKVLPEPSKIPGSHLIFELPRLGLLKNACFEVTIRTNNSVNIPGWQRGSILFRKIELKAKEKVICSNCTNYQRIDSKTRPLGYQSNINVLMSAQTQNGEVNYANTPGIHYVPFITTFFEDPKNYLDLSFLEQMQIEVDVNTLKESGFVYFGSSFNVQFTQYDVKLYLQYVTMDDVFKSMYYKDVFSSLSTRLITDTYMEQDLEVKTGPGTAEHIFPLKCPYNIKRTFIYASSYFGAYGDPYSMIMNKTSLKFNGKLAFDLVPGSVINYFDRDSANTFMTTSNDISVKQYYGSSRNFFIINWGENKDLSSNSGGINLGKINNPLLIINATITGNLSFIRIIHEVYKLCTIDPESGYISATYNS